MNNLMKNTIDETKQLAVIVSVEFYEKNIDYAVEELEGLVEAAGGEVVGVITQKRNVRDVALYVGKGKAEEIMYSVRALDANIVIVDDELSGSQIRNLEAVVGCKVIDRNMLILDIFAIRATTKVAKLQVELAQLKYRLPRLTGLGVALSRQGGGIGTRGPGEQKLETDKRHILNRIHDISTRLKEAQKNRFTQRESRKKNEIKTIAIVGYTNAGKSTLLNALVEEDEKMVFEKDMLFATLDTSTRKVMLDEKKEVVVTDTVGFVSRLPHHLVDAFKSTLEEVVEADYIIHLVDATNENYKIQIETTEDVLMELGAIEKETLYVYNKIDLVDEIVLLPKSNQLAISAKTGLGMDKLLSKLKEDLFNDLLDCELLIPYTEGSALNDIVNNNVVSDMDYKENGTYFKAELTKEYVGKYRKYIVG